MEKYFLVGLHFKSQYVCWINILNVTKFILQPNCVHLPIYNTKYPFFPSVEYFIKLIEWLKPGISSRYQLWILYRASWTFAKLDFLICVWGDKSFDHKKSNNLIKLAIVIFSMSVGAVQWHQPLLVPTWRYSSWLSGNKRQIGTRQVSLYITTD